jgi:hypothetical protein
MEVLNSHYRRRLRRQNTLSDRSEALWAHSDENFWKKGR